MMRCLWMLVICCLLTVSGQGVAQTTSQATFKEVSVHAMSDVQLNIGLDIDLSLSKELQLALNKGMPLFFSLELRLYQPRQLWFDKRVYEESKAIGIRYNMLLREWRVFQNGTEFKEFSLEDAIRRITKLNNWFIRLPAPLREKQLYSGEIRLRLDTSLLARPFQITALNNTSAWSFSSSWKKFNFQFSDLKHN